MHRPIKKGIQVMLTSYDDLYPKWVASFSLEQTLPPLSEHQTVIFTTHSPTAVRQKY